LNRKETMREAKREQTLQQPVTESNRNKNLLEILGADTVCWLLSFSAEQLRLVFTENRDLMNYLLNNTGKLSGVSRREFRGLVQRVNEYAGEIIPTNCGYPLRYSPNSLANQLKTLLDFYPGLDSEHIKEYYVYVTKPNIPRHAELLQITPKLSSIARIFQISDPYGAGYGECLKILLGNIQKSQDFKNYCTNGFSSNHARLLAESRDWLEKAENSIPGDFIAIPMQSGEDWGGYSTRNARQSMEMEGQIPLPAWVAGHHLLTHPERETRQNQLHIVCGGDEYSQSADGEFDSTLCFYYQFDHLIICDYQIDIANEFRGSASAIS